jgi:hypothetical protein
MSTRVINDKEYIATQSKDLESELEYRININAFKNSNRCEKDGDLNLATRIDLDSEMKRLRKEDSTLRTAAPSCSNAGSCTPAEIKSTIEASAGLENVKFVTTALCFEYANYVQNNVPRMEVKEFDPSRFTIDN